MMDFKPAGVTTRKLTYLGRDALEVTMPASAYQDPTREALSDRDFMAWTDIDFGDGVISLKLASELAADAPAYARGFVGVAFRIDNAKRFEKVYLRPANSRVDDQVRRNRSIQYAAYPDFRFARLREEDPGKYETYVDIGLGEWIDMRIEVHQTGARVFINNAAEPTLVISDLKYGSAQRGGVGLWIESGTIGYFADLSITDQPA